jgi:hypothetical protein
MKPIPFEHNTKDMSFEYIRSREGPNQFVCYYKHSSVLRQDPKDAWRVLGVAKFTDTGKILKEWCLDMHQKWVSDRQEKQDKGRADTSFASEAIKETEPNDNTKMVV